MIRRRGQRQEESSSDEEDAFAELSKKAKRSRSESQSNSQKNQSDSMPDTKTTVLPPTITSSMKRHHRPNDDRKAKMDALLQELEAEKQKVSKEPYRFVPDKKGSFVDPSEEHLTTNIFVGNLAPSITEEDLTELFLQFGELYSIKIMWPRTQAERSRKRNTGKTIMRSQECRSMQQESESRMAGFVCFMNREDAEEAMEACNESDPFNVGRLLMMRWGKNVKKNVRQGTGGGISIQPLHQGERETPASTVSNFEDPDEISLREDGVPTMIQFKGPYEPVDISKAAKFLPEAHSENAIRVKAPADPDRFHFISTIASFIAKDGSQLERKLIEQEGSNPQYSFLVYNSAKTEAQKEEHIFYRWRVYSFCQGDTFSNWRTEPFVMFHPNGRYWIPPPLDRAASSKEREAAAERNQNIRRQKDKRAEQCAEDKAEGKKEFYTGRQIERARNNRRKGNRRNASSDSRTTLSVADRDKFNLLVRKKLSISREAICAAMAYCFEKSGAAQEIATLLKETLLDDSPHVTVDMRIARLYLLSDILFNSQQPGVRNAFMYRDALEKMAPEIFTSLGRHGSGQVGRMTMNKLRTAVSTVLGAWTEWSVYNPAFLDELEARFSGKEMVDKNEPQKETLATSNNEKTDAETEAEEKAEVVIKQARGDWTEVATEEEEEDDDDQPLSVSRASPDNSIAGRGDQVASQTAVGAAREGHILRHHKSSAPDGDDGRCDNHRAVPGEEDRSYKTPRDTDGERVDDDLDGEPMDEDGTDSSLLEPQANGVDGEALDGEDIDGEALGEEDSLKKHVGKDIDGEPLDDQEAGQQLDSGDLDGEALDDEEVFTSNC